MMLSIESHRRYFLCTEPMDMRKGFDSLSGWVRQQLGKEPLSSDVYLFFNTRRTHVKILIWEGDGFAIYYKRLEKGSFEIPPFKAGQDHISLSALTIQFILHGISLTSIKWKKRWKNNVENFTKIIENTK